MLTMQMLTKAQFKFNSESSQLTITNTNTKPSPTKLFSDLFSSSKPVADNNDKFPISLNTSLCLSPSTSNNYSESQVKEINPMIQKLLVPLQQPVPPKLASASTKTLDEIESRFMATAPTTAHDILSEELKRKLNIESSKG